VVSTVHWSARGARSSGPRLQPDPLAETELRRGLAIGQGDVGVMFTGPITLGIYTVILLAVGIVVVARVRSTRRATAPTAPESTPTG
jgi:putative tricarboxylic transport membrane protein